MNIEQINAMDAEAFVAALGWIFEESPWVAQRAWRSRPFADRASLHAAMVGEVVKASNEEQLALLRAHPDLGTRARISEASQGEQAGVGLDRLTPAEFESFQKRNAAYREKFGFPFLIAVKGSTKEDIVRALEVRLGASREEELQEALRQVYRIAGFRLEGVTG
jgi:2-oxo-4-hydroxy-4-carboxy-5-ureidoimidazoline decarboxylase